MSRFLSPLRGLLVAFLIVAVFPVIGAADLNGRTRTPDDASVAGTWQVSTQLGHCRLAAVLTLEEGRDGWEGYWNSLGRRYALTAVEVDGDRVRLTWRVAGESVSFDATWSGDALRGTVSSDGPRTFGRHTTTARRAKSDATRRVF